MCIGSVVLGICVPKSFARKEYASYADRCGGWYENGERVRCCAASCPSEGATAVAALPALSLKRDRVRNGNVNASFISLRP